MSSLDPPIGKPDGPRAILSHGTLGEGGASALHASWVAAPQLLLAKLTPPQEHTGIRPETATLKLPRSCAVRGGQMVGNTLIFEPPSGPLYIMYNLGLERLMQGERHWRPRGGGGVKKFRKRMGWWSAESC
jgi:hypothetical protein